MSNLSTLPKGDSAWLLRKAIERIIQQVSVLETNIGSSTTGNSTNTQVIFNDNGTLRGDAAFTFVPSTDILTVTGFKTFGTTQLSTIGILYVGTIATPKLKVDVAGTGITTITQADITGDLTVRTNKLKVDATGVGIGTASPTSGTLTVQTHYLLFPDSQTKIGDNGFCNGAASDGNTQIQFFGGKSLFFNEGASNTKMTLNSTGLGIGTTILGGQKLAIGSSSDTSATTNGFNIVTSRATIATTCNGAVDAAGTTINYSWANGGQGPLIFRNAAISNVLTLDSAGNVGIGVTPSVKLDVLSAAAEGTIRLTSTIDGSNASPKASSLSLRSGTSSVETARIASFNRFANVGGGDLVFSTADTSGVLQTRATIDSSGNLLVGTTSALAAWATRLTLSTDAGTTKWAVGPYAAATNFIISADGGYGVYLNGTTATSWTGISDERLKDIIEPISNAVAKVGQLRSVIGKFKSDETNTRRSFLIAQDVQAVLPEAVDASNPDRLGVAYTEVIPLLVAAIKELTARVQTLETR